MTGDNVPTRYADSVGIIDGPRRLRVGGDLWCELTLPVVSDSPADESESSAGRLIKCDNRGCLLSDRRSIGFANCDATDFQIEAGVPTLGPLALYTCKIAYVEWVEVDGLNSVSWWDNNGNKMHNFVVGEKLEIRIENALCYFRAVGIGGLLAHMRVYALT